VPVLLNTLLYAVAAVLAVTDAVAGVALLVFTSTVDAAATVHAAATLHAAAAAAAFRKRYTFSSGETNSFFPSFVLHASPALPFSHE